MNVFDGCFKAGSWKVTGFLCTIAAMIKLLTGLAGAILFLLLLCFALSNPQGVDIGMWPMTSMLHVPLYAVALVPMLAGLMFGCGLGWVLSLPHRLKIRRLNHELSAITARFAELQKNVGFTRTSPLMKKKFWKRRLWN